MLLTNKKLLPLPYLILMILSLSLFIFFFGLGNYGLLDKDEPRYAYGALDMLRTNDWIVPKFNLQDAFDKPILFYWLIAFSYKFFGISDFTSRLPSAACATLCVLFTWYTAKKVFGRKVAFLSAIILATSIEFILLGRRAATDIALCLFFTGSLYSIFLSYYIKDFKLKIYWCIVAGVFCGLSVLTKGPVGVLLPLIILTFFLILKRQFDIKHLRIYFIILFFMFLISLPWYVAVHVATNGGFTREFFFLHNLKRFTSVVGDHPGPFWFYIPVVLGGFMPWTLFLIYSLAKFLNPKILLKKNLNKLIQFSLVWIVTVFLFFSFSTTKLATYILLIFPPLSILTAYWVLVLSRKNLALLKRTFVFTTLLLTPIIFYVFNLFSKWNLEETFKTPLLIKMIFVVIFLFTGILFSFFIFKKTYQFVVSFALCFVLSFVLGLNFYLVPYYRHTHEDLRNFALIAKKIGAKQIISFGMYRPSLVYYSGLPVDFSDKKEQKLLIKSCSDLKSKVCIIGHTNDLENHKELFKNVKILDKQKKYFIGIFVS